MIARMLGGAYEPRHARKSARAVQTFHRRGRYRAGIRQTSVEFRSRLRNPEPVPSAGLYAWCLVAVVGALTWPIPAVIS